MSKSLKESQPISYWVWTGLAAGALALSMCVAEVSEDSGGDGPSGAWVAACDAVKARLVSPGSAEFPWSYNSQGAGIEKVGDMYYVSGYVDSQNRMGASIRSQWTCAVQPEGERYRVVSVSVR